MCIKTSEGGKLLVYKILPDMLKQNTGILTNIYSKKHEVVVMPLFKKGFTEA